MNWISNWFLRIGVLAGLCGMAIGIAMAATHDHSQTPLHAHVNLIGWVSMVLYGLVYRTIPSAAESRLASWQFGLSVSGLIAILPGLALIGMGQPGTGAPFAIAGSVLTIASMLLFAVIVFGATRAARHVSSASFSDRPRGAT
jgi:hypothetical protein